MSALIFKVLMTLSLTRVEGDSSDGIYAYTVNARGIEFRVPSNGCSWKSSFDLRLRTTKETRVIHIRRFSHDPCLALQPGGVRLMFLNSELGITQGQRILVTNELIE